MQGTKRSKIQIIREVLGNFFYNKKLPKRYWIAKTEEGTWIAIDNSSGDCRTEEFKTEFATRLWLEAGYLTAEDIRGY